jgi:hypothetical protein
MVHHVVETLPERGESLVRAVDVGHQLEQEMLAFAHGKATFLPSKHEVDEWEVEALQTAKRVKAADPTWYRQWLRPRRKL